MMYRKTEKQTDRQMNVKIKTLSSTFEIISCETIENKYKKRNAFALFFF